MFMPTDIVPKPIFEERLGPATSSEAIDEYIQFVHIHATASSKTTQKHHLLPISIFPEYKNTESNIFALSYPDHVTAHILLATAYPINKFTRPCNFMVKYGDPRYNHSEMLSQSITLAWNEFKKTKKYTKWRKSKSSYMKKFMNTGGADKMAEINKRHYKEHPERRAARSVHFKGLWTNPELRKKMIAKRKRWFRTPEGKAQYERTLALARAAFQTPENLAKMTLVNQDPVKRKDAGVKLKKLWQSPAYRKKQKENRTITYWWNNGQDEVKSITCPDGYIRGRIKGRPRAKKDRL